MKTVEQLRILSDEVLQVLYAKALRKEADNFEKCLKGELK